MIASKIRQKPRFSINYYTKRCVFDFLIGFILSRSQIFMQLMPLGVAFSVASNNIFATVGAFLSYIFIDGSDFSYKYAGAVLVIASISRIFKINKYIITTAVMLMAHIINIAIIGFSYNLFLNMIINTSLCVGSVYLYNQIFKKNSDYKSVSMLYLLVGIITSLSTITLFFDLSVVRIFCVFIILCATYFTKNGTGCVLSVVLGVAMDSVIGINFAIFTIGYSFSSVVSGVFRDINKTVFALSFIIIYSISAVFSMNSSIYINSILEVIIGAVGFVFIPNRHLKNIRKVLKEKENPYNSKIYEMTSNASDILEKLSASVASGMTKVNRVSYSDINKIISVATNNVCTNCSGYQKCYIDEYNNTKDILNFASNKAIERGYFESLDFKSHFNCINFKEFLHEINCGIMAVNENTKLNEVLEQNKDAVYKQYKAVSAVLKDITNTKDKPIETFPNLEKRIAKYLFQFSEKQNVLVYNNQIGQMYVEISSSDVFVITENKHRIEKFISSVLERPVKFLSKSCSKEREVIIFREIDKYFVDISTKCVSKEKVCGDISTSFKNDYSTEYVILSDGMGSGEKAHDESFHVVNILQRLFKTGVSMTKALRTIAPLSVIKNNEQSFVALDVLSINTSTLEAEIAKYGAMPTYVYRNGKTHKISSSNLPLGLNTKGEISRLTFKRDDVIILTTDGFEIDNDELIEILNDNSYKNSSEISQKIMQKNKVFDDDTTIVVMKICMNKFC